MRIILKPQDYNEILLYCQKKLPNEACGLLAGNIDGEIKTIEKVYCLTNLDQSPQHFSMDPQEQFTAIKEIRRMGWV
ncbi:MAG TPA: M67 family metallopeptidase, partial [Desulfosporosinus sp.]|nr:M67 family metallopeptidase [Desulfosporosinus sp.]